MHHPARSLARITNAGNLTLAVSGTYLQATSGNRKVRFSGQGVTLIHDSSSAFGMVACASDATTVLARVCGSYAVNDALKWTYYGGTYDSPAIAILGNKNVGIGTTAPTKLDVNGAIHANGWIGTTGNVGWKSDTHGGGIYMADATWVRTYNGKAFYTAGGTIRSDGKLQCGANSEFSVDKDGNLSSTKARREDKHRNRRRHIPIQRCQQYPVVWHTLRKDRDIRHSWRNNRRLGDILHNGRGNQCGKTRLDFPT